MSLKDTYQSRKNLLASNLTSMGVTASGSEGLTSLINKVLDIVPATLTLATNKNILSYYDSETATLTATHSLGAGKTVEVYNAVTGSKIGDMTDAGGGTYTYTYNSQGVGNISMTAVSGNLESDSILIEDCTFYDATPYGNTSHTFNINLPSHFSLEYIINQADTNNSVPYLDIGDSSNNRMLVGQYARSGTNGLIIYKGSQTNHPYSTNPTINQENSIYFKYDGTKYYYSLNEGAIMEIADANVTLTKLIHSEGGAGGYLKNIKIKPITV